MWKRFRKKPIVIRARPAIAGEKIKTLEGTMTANEGDMIIEGIEGELYPCKREIFHQTYEPE